MGLVRLLCNWFSMCSAESYIALMYDSAAAWKDFVLWNLHAALDFWGLGFWLFSLISLFSLVLQLFQASRTFSAC